VPTEAAPPHIRRQIVEAAERLIADRGLKGATTRAIAERAGCAEGSIYRYFPDKHALFMEVVRTSSPEFPVLVDSLLDRAGQATVRGTLEEVAIAALGFYRSIMPMAAGAMAERGLLMEQRRHFKETKRGPMHAIAILAGYVRKEQRLGRILDRLSADHVARTLLGTCFAQAFMMDLLGEEAALGSDEQFAREVVRGLMEGLQPKSVVKVAAS
jgi:AcrR family transcriptional regulator